VLGAGGIAGLLTGATNTQLAGGPAITNPVSDGGPVGRSGPWLAGGSALTGSVGQAAGQVGHGDLRLARDPRVTDVTRSQSPGRPITADTVSKPGLASNTSSQFAGGWALLTPSLLGD